MTNNKKCDDLIAWIAGKMRVNDITDQQMAEYIKIHPNSFAYKMKNGNFKYPELVTVFSVLHAEPDIVYNLMINH